MCASSRLADISPVLQLKQLLNVGSTDDGRFSCFQKRLPSAVSFCIQSSTPGERWCDSLDVVPTGSVVSSS